MKSWLPTLEDRDALQDHLNECRANDEQNVLLHQEPLAVRGQVRTAATADTEEATSSNLVTPTTS